MTHVLSDCADHYSGITQDIWPRLTLQPAGFHSSAVATNLPDLIRCEQDNSAYQLVLVIKSPQLPAGVSALGLKNGTSVVFKVAAQTYTDESGLLSLIEAPANASSKQAKLDIQSKVATLLNFRLPDLESGSTFKCQF